ncbi:hypothetical protein DFH07DRAFT_767103 [Mycena maculata]|uniref:Uncharacterized protein n=1 Tax=Mycena maculata TaxID=230809 RepID=A0AAD7NUN5_9AGAR|nr:hypothetical protein DFH07DRAFT_767103 [Mycena maculata]
MDLHSDSEIGIAQKNQTWIFYSLDHSTTLTWQDHQARTIRAGQCNPKRPVHRTNRVAYILDMTNTPEYLESDRKLLSIDKYLKKQASVLVPPDPDKGGRCILIVVAQILQWHHLTILLALRAGMATQIPLPKS